MTPLDEIATETAKRTIRIPFTRKEARPMTAEIITRKKNEKLLDQVRSAAFGGDNPYPVPTHRLIAILEHALSEPTRLAAARAEGVREGIEMAAQVASNAAWRYEDDDASMTGGPEAGARYQVGECVKAIKALSPVPTWTPTHRHYKGGLYREIMRCEGADGDDLVPVVIYENEVGRRFARDAAVFDGQIVKQDAGGLPYLDVRRFEPIAPAPAEAPTTPTVDALTDAWRLAEQDKARIAALEAENAALRERNEKLAEALRPLAAESERRDSLAPGPDIDHWPIGGNYLTYGDLRRARALLQGQGGADGR